MKPETDNTKRTKAVKTTNSKSKKNKRWFRRFFYANNAQAKTKAKAKQTLAVNKTNSERKLKDSCTDKQVLGIETKVKSTEAVSKTNSERKLKDSCTDKQVLGIETKVKSTEAVSKTNSEFELQYSCTDKQALEILIQSRTTYCRAIQVSTRGVGLIVASSLMTAQKQGVDPDAFPLHPMYRVMLAFTEEKLALIYATEAKKLANVSVYHLKPNVGRVAVLSTVTAFPKFAIAYIEGLGTFTHEGIVFVPILPKNRRHNDNTLCPDPGKIILSNLKEVILSMNNSQINLQWRKEFVIRNPIPGAVYDNKFLLKQGRDIMPVKYNNNNLRQDIKKCNKFFEEHREYLREKNWIGGCPSLKSSKGMPGVAVIQPRLMRIPYNCTAEKLCKKGIAFSIRNSVSMFSPIPLQTTEWLHGAACLYREPPEYMPEYLYHPYWNGCDEGSNPYSITAHPADIIEVLFDMEVNVE